MAEKKRSAAVSSYDSHHIFLKTEVLNKYFSLDFLVRNTCRYIEVHLAASCLISSCIKQTMWMCCCISIKYQIALIFNVKRTADVAVSTVHHVSCVDELVAGAFRTQFSLWIAQDNLSPGGRQKKKNNTFVKLEWTAVNEQRLKTLEDVVLR